MTIEQKLAILKRAVELGASIDIHFHGKKTESEAEAVAKEMSELFGAPYEKNQHQGTHWFKTMEDYTLECYFPFTKEDEDGEVV